MGINETANTFHISRNTVRKYVRLFISSGKTTEQLLALSEEHLREMFGCKEFRHREPSQRQLELDALIPGYVARLSRKGMTVRKLFNEYRMGSRNRRSKERYASTVSTVKSLVTWSITQPTRCTSTSPVTGLKWLMR